jgi:hypothetical protein
MVNGCGLLSYIIFFKYTLKVVIKNVYIMLSDFRPWGPLSLLKIGIWSFPGGRKRPGRDADPSLPSSAEV